MTSKLYTDTITADGTYVFPRLDPAREYVFEVRYAAGTGTAAIGYDNGADVFAAFRDGNGAALSASTNGGWRVTIPGSGKPALTVSSASGLTLTVALTPCES